MHGLPLGWTTDLAVLAHGGSLIEDRGDHLVISSPHNPDHHWGNFLVVTDPGQVANARHWQQSFTDTFPDAEWLAVGLIGMPADATGWVELGAEVDMDEVLTTDSRPRLLPCPDGYTSRRLETTADWDQLVALDLAENQRSNEFDPAEHLRFANAQAATRRRLSEQGVAAFVGAFAGEELVADLGIVRCGSTARYQSVGTEPEHRRRGLAGHLLGLAATWSEQVGCHRWVIITEATKPAGRVYRSVGFEPCLGNAQAYRRPPIGAV